MAFDQIGRAMVKEAGDDIEIDKQDEIIKKYSVADTISLLGSIQGSFEDWAYAAGWDDSNQVVDRCAPSSVPELPEDFFIANFTDNSTLITESPTKNIRTAIFKIKTGAETVEEDPTDPTDLLYGGR